MGREHVERFLAGEQLTARESAFHSLVRASHSHDESERRAIVLATTGHLRADEIYHANAVISLFNFYNKFVDLNGVSELSAEGYAASGVRLSTHGYGPPATK
jgi:hypothetical protein